MAHIPSPTSRTPLSAALVARREALTCLQRIIEEGQTLDAALAPIHSHCSLSAIDKGFAEHLIRATLKRRYAMEALLAPLLRHPLASMPMTAQLILLIGAVQLHAMDVPAYAAVNTSVELAKHLRLHSLSGLINAVLKKVGQAPSVTPVFLRSMPAWLTSRLRRDYGKEGAEAILAASMEDMKTLDITIAHPARADYFAAQWGGTRIGATTVRIAAGSEIRSLEGYDAGEWWVQNYAAALPISAIRHLVQGKRVLDVCAAPGGKTMQLAAYGAEVTAIDSSSVRLKRMQENLTRTKLNATVLCADALTYAPTERYDVVVVDAPCSATGTLRRHPDLLYHRTDADVKALCFLQQQMLNAALTWVKPNGYVLYCVCSLLKDEGEAQIEAWLAAHPTRLRRTPLEGMDATYVDAKGDYRALPTHLHMTGGMDGFFAALVQVGGAGS
jgi:16S rRNA (cytosine967-C5)-methyltransferase